MIPSLAPPESWWCLYGREKLGQKSDADFASRKVTASPRVPWRCFIMLLRLGWCDQVGLNLSQGSLRQHLNPHFFVEVLSYHTPVPNPDAVLCCCSCQRFSWGFQTSSSISRNWNRHSSFALEALTRAVGEGFVLHIKDFSDILLLGGERLFMRLFSCSRELTNINPSSAELLHLWVVVGRWSSLLSCLSLELSGRETFTSSLWIWSLNFSYLICL